MTPGERLDIIVSGFTEGETFAIESLPYNRRTSIKPKPDKYATVKVGALKPSAAFISEDLRKIEALAPKNASGREKQSFLLVQAGNTALIFW